MAEPKTKKEKIAIGVFASMVTLGIGLPLLLAPKDKKMASAVMYGAFAVIVGGGISLGISGKLKSYS